jgi:hypothetical protein
MDLACGTAHRRGMRTRPTSLLSAVVLVAITGAAALSLAGLLLAVAAGVFALLGPSISPAAWVVAAAATVFGAAGLVAAIGLWQGRTWAWPIAAGVQLVGTLGAVVAIATSGPQAPTVIGTAMVAAGLAAVIAPDTRRALTV